ncbi:MAG TPA: hypothetical protein VE263_20630 [Candidatus Angelobacter sp.]|nr:hypothetical protein [Candidatus Angelobacter sp.]
MALFELFYWLRYFRQQRQEQNLSQWELLKQELKMIGLAFLTIALLIGLVMLAARFL